MHIDVREAEHGDLGRLRTWLDADDLDYLRARLSRTHDDVRVLAALVRQELVGVIAVAWHPADEGEIRAHLTGVPIMFRLRVAPGYRRRGVGTALVVDGEALLRRRAHRRVLVGVDHGNIPARRFYTKLGYRPHPSLGGLTGDPPYDILVADLHRR